MSQELFHQILTGQADAALDREFPFYPLTSPKMPIPGADFIEYAVALGDPPPVIEGRGDSQQLVSCGPRLEYLYRRALYDEQFQLPVSVKGRRLNAPFVPGHLIGDETTNCGGGPRPAEVMIVGQNPGRDEIAYRRNFVGPTSQVFIDALDELGVPDSDRHAWYITNLLKFPNLDPQSDSVPVAHKKDCALLLEQELRLVRPRFVLCLGSHASKWLAGPACGVEAMVGRATDLFVPIYEAGEAPRYHHVKVMAITHPAAVYRRPELYDSFKTQLGLFLSLVNGATIGGREDFIVHRNIYKERDLAQIVDEIRKDPDPWRRVIAVDAEWHGQYPTEPGAYLRTVQFSSRHGEGICVVLRHQGGEPAFQPSIGAAIHQLNRLLKRDGDWQPQVGGHFFRADLPWLIHSGLDLRDEYAPADRLDACRTSGGWDTGLMYHAVNEATSYRLTDMLVRLTTAPVYDTRIKDLVTDFCRQQGIKKEDLEGYGFLPDWELHSPEGLNYAAYDSDCTRRIVMRHLTPGGLLDKDWFGTPSWEPFWVSHRASLGVLEMEMNGVMLDRERVDGLTRLFTYARDALLAALRRNIKWEEKLDANGKVIQAAFNPESAQQCVAFLFGDRFSTKRNKETNEIVSIRPPEAVCLNLEPVKSTGKRPRLWADLVARRETHSHNPSTDKEVLGILGHSHPLAMQLRDVRFITQVLKGPLRPPMTDAVNAPVTDSDGFMEYEAGLASFIQSDGRVRTHISQCKETGRYASARPPLQNISNRRESDYARILGTWDPKSKKCKGAYTHIFPHPLYAHPIGSIFRASPGHVLVKADYTGAEVAGLAWLSGDVNMIEYVRRNALPEDHPDYYNIHANTAIKAFHLTCPPTKQGLKDSGHAGLYTAAKNIRFGLPYGRSPQAIARQCREEGVDVTDEDCERLAAAYFAEHPQAEAYLADQRRRSQEQRLIYGCYGRKRRFIQSRDRGIIGEQERQAQNFSIQNLVAEACQVAIYNFTQIRKTRPDIQFRMLLQIHDALLFEVPYAHVRAFVRDVLYPCMVYNVPIYPRYSDNRPMPVEKPYFFGIDVALEENWGEKLTHEREVELDLVGATEIGIALAA